MPRVAEFSESHRHIDLRIETTDPGESTCDRADVNIVLTERPPLASDVAELFPVRYVPACSPALHARYSRLGPQVLEQATLLVHQDRPEAWHRWAELAGLRPPPPRQIICLDSMFALARAAERGAGIGLIPMPISQAWFRTGVLLRLFNQDLRSSDSYYVVASTDVRHPDATGTLWQWIVSTFAESACATRAA